MWIIHRNDLFKYATIMTDSVATALDRVKPLIINLSGEQVAEFCAGLIGIAMMRDQRENGDLHAAELMSSLSGHASDLGLDLRRKLIQEEKA